VKDGVGHSNLLVADCAVLLIHFITNLLLDWNKVGLVSVVAFLHRFVNTNQYGVFPANMEMYTMHFLLNFTYFSSSLNSSLSTHFLNVPSSNSKDTALK
jgi:hypothetical protein